MCKSNQTAVATGCSGSFSDFTRRCFKAEATPMQNLLQQVTDRVASQTSALSGSRRYHRGLEKLEDDYVLTQTVLGVGINGGVRLVNSRVRTGRQYAVKTIDLVRQSTTNQKMLDTAWELEILLSVDHANITRLVDVYETETELQLVMEYCEGGELFDRMIQKGTFSEDEAAQASHQMLSVVSYLHKQGIIHRDLKPENFLYQSPESPNLKLIDFGCSRRQAPGTASVAEPCGTLAYSAPEILRRSCTSQSDLWSLGVIIFMLISGYAPFEGDKVQQTADITTGRYTWRPSYWSHISAEGVDFVKSFLHFDPVKRLTALSALEHSWITSRVYKLSPLSNIQCINVVQGLSQFQAATKLRKAALLTMARSMTSGDIDDEVRNLFLQFDHSHSGMIEVRHLVEVVTTLSFSGNPDGLDADTQKALNKLPHGSTIDYSSFLAAMTPSMLIPIEDLVLDAYRRFDHDSSVAPVDRKLSVQQFSEVVHEAVVGGGKPFTPVKTINQPIILNRHSSSLFNRPCYVATPKKKKDPPVPEKKNKWWKRLWEDLSDFLEEPTHEIGASTNPGSSLFVMEATFPV